MGFSKRTGEKIRITSLAMFLILSIAASTPLTSASVNNGWTARTFYHVHRQATTSPTGYSPTDIQGFYNLPTSGGSGTIAIIDAYDSQTVANDLATFSSTFKLGAANFEKHMMSSSIPVDSGWGLEIALDVQWAHAIAPSSKILLVEANSNNLTDLLAAVDYARNRSDVVAISMSWGGGEFSTESLYDSYFTSQYGISFFASSGDSGAGVIWPSSSSNVVAVGGTTLTKTSETGWSGSGGGASAYESTPAYQSSLGYAKRVVPDVSYDADPVTGFSVYDSSYNGQSGWLQVGGTSAGSPQWAAIQALGLSSNNANFYADAKSASYSTYFRDIISGSNGVYSAKTGYDLVTGLGSPITTIFGAAPTPDFSISANPSALNALTTGSTLASTVTVSALSGFTGSVDLSSSSIWVTFGTSTVTAPGSSSLTINVPSGTSVGTQSITISGKSGSLTHTTTINVNVQAPATSLRVKVTTDKTSYTRGQTVSITVSVTDGVNPVSGVSVSVKVTNPRGSTSTLSATTNSGGKAVVRYRLSSSAQRGTYKVMTTASKTGYHSASASASFTVN
jgi:subtilase family serine protease